MASRSLGLVLLAAVSACMRADVTPEREDASLEAHGVRLDVDVASDVEQPRAVIDEWVARGVEALAAYYGRFPVERLEIRIGRLESRFHGMPVNGVTYGASRIEVELAPSVGAGELEHDWVLVHEMFHLAFPTLDRRHVWVGEGLSDYLEPLARARAGQIDEARVWQEFVRGLPRGLPRPGDGGLDGTDSRDRIYWGGNLYWLLADLRIREATSNAKSIDDAVRAIWREGGNGSVRWPLERVFEVARRATGTDVLADLYREMGPEPVDVDLRELWARLGVVVGRRGRITFDDGAPLAAIRKSLTAREF